MTENTDLNVLGEALQLCSTDPLTGATRDGCCSYHALDRGRHWVCATLTDAFLQFTATQGNDLISPRPEYDFPGLKAGDRWCLCLDRWLEAKEAGVAPPVNLEATNSAILSQIAIEDLRLDPGRS